MNNLSEKGKVKMGIVILLVSVIVFGFIGTIGGFMISYTGGEMAGIRSVGGNSIAEAYYQLHGEIYASMGKIIAYVNLGICFIGTTYSILLLKTSKEALKVMGNEIKMVTNDMKDRTVRAAHEFSKEKADTAAEPKQQEEFAAEAEASSSCDEEERACPSCGAVVTKDASFCTKCGQKIN